MVKKRYFSKSEVEHMVLNFEINRVIKEKNYFMEEIVSDCKCEEDGLIYELIWERVSAINNTPEFHGQLATSKEEVM